MEWKRVHYILNDGGWILYFCDTIQYKIISAAEKEKISAILKGIDSGSYLAMFSDASQQEFETLRYELENHGEKAAVVPEEGIRLTLNAANSCNMCCGYCYANGGVYHSAEQLMPVETAIRAVDMFYERFNTLGSIKFIGGEPLMNKPVVFAVCDHVQELFDAEKIPTMPSFIVATNGTILDEEIIEYSKRYRWRVGLSFDGPETIHNMVRTYRGGTPTGDIIIQNIRRWKAETGGRCPSSVNACYHGLHERSGVSVVDAIRYMKDVLGIEKVNIVPVDASKDSSFSLNGSAAFQAAIHEILDSCSPEYRRYLFTKLKSLERAIRNHVAMPGSVCKAGLTTFGVSVGGIISPCHMLTDNNGFYMGDVYDDNALYSSTFQEVQQALASYDRYESTCCKNCFANRLCIGCLGGNAFRSGDPYRADPYVCEMLKCAVTELIRDIAAMESGQ